MSTLRPAPAPVRASVQRFRIALTQAVAGGEAPGPVAYGPPGPRSAPAPFARPTGAAVAPSTAALGRAATPSVATAKPKPADDEAHRGERERQQELANAMREVSVTMYSTSWCPVCTKARSYLQQQGIPFVERDVEASTEARSAQRALNPRGSVPTIDIEGTVIVGFSATGIDAARRAAAERRVARW